MLDANSDVNQDPEKAEILAKQIVRRTRVSTWHELPKDLPPGQAETGSYFDIRVSSPFCALMRNRSVS